MGVSRHFGLKKGEMQYIGPKRGESQPAKLKRVHPSVSGRNRMQLCMLSLISVWKKAKKVKFYLPNIQIQLSKFSIQQVAKLL